MELKNRKAHENSMVTTFNEQQRKLDGTNLQEPLEDCSAGVKRAAYHYMLDEVIDAADSHSSQASVHIIKSKDYKEQVDRIQSNSENIAKQAKELEDQVGAFTLYDFILIILQGHDIEELKRKISRLEKDKAALAVFIDKACEDPWGNDC